MRSTDVMIHINESLAKDSQKKIESELRSVEGVIAPRFNKPHLLVVDYDADLTSSPALLKQITNSGYHAQLVGL